MARSRILIVAGVLVIVIVAGAWYVFRPDTASFDRVVDEPHPGRQATVRLSGTFSPRAHQGRGRAEVLELEGGRRVLRFSDFETLDGPDLYVYLVASPDVSDGDELEAGGYLSLGPLKGNIGPQNYEIPPGADLAGYRGVAVWCYRFSVNFTAAALSAP